MYNIPVQILENDILTDYDIAVMLLVKKGKTLPRYPLISRMQKNETREVSFDMLRAHVSANARIRTRLLGEMPPRIPDYVLFRLVWDAETTQLLEVYIRYPDTDEFPLELEELPFELPYRWRPYEPDDLVLNSEVYDTYLTLDFDIEDYDEDYEKVEKAIWTAKYLKWLGHLKEYEIHRTQRGYHIIFRFNRPVNVYMTRLLLGDDMDRMKLDVQRYYFSGVHDTLFTHKSWVPKVNNEWKAKRNEWRMPDNIRFDP